MADPEIQMILTDPMVRQVLNDLKENPKHGQQVMALDDLTYRGGCLGITKMEHVGMFLSASIFFRP